MVSFISIMFHGRAILGKLLSAKIIHIKPTEQLTNRKCNYLTTCVYQGRVS